MMRHWQSSSATAGASIDDGPLFGWRPHLRKMYPAFRMESPASAESFSWPFDLSRATHTHSAHSSIYVFLYSFILRLFSELCDYQCEEYISTNEHQVNIQMRFLFYIE